MATFKMEGVKENGLEMYSKQLGMGKYMHRKKNLKWIGF